LNTSIWEFILSLLNIIFLDLILAGDNAIVIGLAARNLPSDTQKKAIVFGTAGAVVLRMIAYKLLTSENTSTDIKAGQSLWSAVGTIILADAAMGLDNVIAIAGAAKHNISLVIIGLLISVPIVVWGSTLFIKLINKYPWIIYIGSAVLGFTASSMITDEHQLAPFFNHHPLLKYLFIIVIIIGILAAGHWKRQSKPEEPQEGTIV